MNLSPFLSTNTVGGSDFIGVARRPRGTSIIFGELENLTLGYGESWLPLVLAFTEAPPSPALRNKSRIAKSPPAPS